MTMPGTAYVFSKGTKPSVRRDLRDPECEIDGDLFWIFVDGDGARLNHKAWEGQASACLAPLLKRHPKLADVEVADDSLAFDPGSTLASLAAASHPVMVAIESVERLYHGTSSCRLDSIMAGGLTGDVPEATRSWKNADASQDHVYLASSEVIARQYAERAARLHGGDPVVIEVDARALDKTAICEDRDFLLLADGGAWRWGAYGDCTGASASLTLTGRVGHLGIVPSNALSAVFTTSPEGTWTREEIATAPKFG